MTYKRVEQAVIDLTGRTAIVTGAGKGLGKAYAELLAARGAAVLVNNRLHLGQTAGSADDVVDTIRAVGGTAVADHHDVEEVGAGRAMVDAALEAFGRIDLVVANAGVSAPSAFHKEPLDQVRQVLEINLLATLELVHAALPHLREQRFGRIAVTTSSAAVFGDAGFATYAASKAALIGFTAALAQESASRNVTK